ncbi:MAG: sulfotransferase [Rickettsiales bacterium]|nr:sulfotransferase [Rickettsiales bacterium]
MNVTTAHELADKTEKLLQKQWFFVAGFEKSGTTWLQKMLDFHPEMRCMGEGHAIRHIGKPLQDLFNTYNAVIKKTNQAVYNNKDVDYRPSDAKTYQAMFMMLVMSTIIETPDDTVKFIGDKTPNNDSYLVPLSNLFPNAKFIHIIRDGRDVLVSYTKHMNRTYDDEEYNYENSAEFISKAWSARIKIGKAFQQQNPGQLHEVRYEDLLTRPHAELKKMYQFLGVTATDEQINEAVEATSFEALSGGRKSGEENVNSFFRKGVSGDWKDELSLEALRIFNENAGDLIKDLGYEE